MRKDKVEAHIKNAIETARKYYPRPIFKGLKIAVYNGSFNWLSITIEGAFGYASGYVANYEAINNKISDFLHRASYNLYEQYWNKHHKNARG